MIKEPRIIVVHSIPYLVSVTKEEGAITQLHGPYQAVGTPGLSPKDFVTEMIRVLTMALHSNPTLTLEDLPENIRNEILASDLPKID